jgi:hypothetical protein
LRTEQAASQRKLIHTQQQLVETQERLDAKNDTIAALYRALAAKSDEITTLNMQTLDAVTGGDSFCYLSIFPTGNKGRLAWVHQGDHTLYDVTARLVNLDRWGEVEGHLSLETLAYANTTLSLGTLIAGHTSMRGEIALDTFPKRGYNIFFSARNGPFHETLRLVNVDGTWKQALRVLRNAQVILEKVDDGYPRNNDGEVAW